MENNINYFRGVILVLLAGTLWSTVGIAVRLIEQASVWQILFFRSISLSIFLYIVIYFNSKGKLTTLIRDNFSSYLYGGIALFFAYAGGIYSIQNTSVANAMLLFGSAPIITAILSAFIIKEQLTVVTIISIIFAFLGILLMVFQETSGNSLNGNIAALASAFAFALFTINLRYRKDIQMLPSIFVSGIVGILLTSIILWVNKTGLVLPKNDVIIALSMGVFQVGSGLVLYTLGSRAVPATQLTILSMGEVLLGPVWVWIFLNEETTSATIIGGTILLTAIIFNAVYGRSSENLN